MGYTESRLENVGPSLNSAMTPEAIEAAAKRAVSNYEAMQENLPTFEARVTEVLKNVGKDEEVFGKEQEEDAKEIETVVAENEISEDDEILVRYRDESDKLSERASGARGKFEQKLRALGLVASLSLNQTEVLAVPQISTEKISEPARVESVAQTEKKEEQDVESFGEAVGISPEEWELYEKYRLHSLWGGLERVTRFGVTPDGKRVEVIGEQMLGTTGGTLVFEDVQKQWLNNENVPNEAQRLVHSHPLAVFRGDYQEISGQYKDKKVGFGFSKEAQEERNALEEKIRRGEMFSAFPPSSPDILAIFSSGFEGTFRVVDPQGVWTYSIDKASPKGKELLAGESFEELLEENLDKEGVSMEEFKLFQEWGRAREAERSIPVPGDKEELEELLRKFELGNRAFNETQEHFHEKFGGKEWDKKHLEEQLKVLKPTADQEEWKRNINEFIKYAKGEGLRVTYSPFKTSLEAVPKEDKEK